MQGITQSFASLSLIVCSNNTIQAAQAFNNFQCIAAVSSRTADWAGFWGWFCLWLTEKRLRFTGFSLGILKHASGTPCLAHFGVPEWKICVQVSEYDESSWSYETRAAPIAMPEFEIRYALSKLTKRSDKVCFPASHSLRTIFCLSFDLP